MVLIPFAGLRIRLVLLVLLAVLPALGPPLSSGLRQRGEATYQAKMRALETVREASSFHKRMIDGARQTLFTVSLLPHVRQHDSAGCAPILDDLLKYSEGYTGFAASAPNGDRFAVAPPATSRSTLQVGPGSSAWCRLAILS